ncbi:MAG TPA: hypothetical protein PLZ01_03260, partial [bacterium]|nr:hypothetical protein [bacterium]
YKAFYFAEHTAMDVCPKYPSLPKYSSTVSHFTNFIELLIDGKVGSKYTPGNRIPFAEKRAFQEFQEQPRLIGLSAEMLAGRDPSQRDHHRRRGV